MIGFLIRKNFYDLWDNLFRVALVNIGFIISLAVPLLLSYVFRNVPALSLAGLGIGVLWCFVYLSAAAQMVRRISDYGSFGFRDFFRGLKTAWSAGLFLGIFSILIIVVPAYGIVFYLLNFKWLGLFLAALIFWVLLITIVSLQFFFAIRYRLDAHLFKALKKCFIIYFDNTGFSLFTLLSGMFSLALSTLLVFLFPGPAGMLLFADEALRLRLLKYDYLEANPDASRKKIPWDALLIEEREKTGARSLKNFIFPWKD
ncbi:MAG: hypothetical protein LBR16_00935 [Treponema sp.]|jgi:hypothetical protein|nr:hypothetical protein [Treponema sp.]